MTWYVEPEGTIVFLLIRNANIARLSPTEARALAAELEQAAHDVEQRATNPNASETP